MNTVTCLPTAETRQLSAPQAFFSGIASTSALDRHQDQIQSQAMTYALEEIRHKQEKIPLFWEHAYHLGPVGYCSRLKVIDQSMHVQGVLDLSQKLGRDIYRSIQKSELFLSLGFRTLRFTPRADTKGRFIHAMLVKEISFVKNPANPEARIYSLHHKPVVSWDKSVDGGYEKSCTLGQGP